MGLLGGRIECLDCRVEVLGGYTDVGCMVGVLAVVQNVNIVWTKYLEAVRDVCGHEVEALTSFYAEKQCC